MADEDKPGRTTSFDPRSWARSDDQAEDGTGANGSDEQPPTATDTSFNPRTWVSGLDDGTDGGSSGFAAAGVKPARGRRPAMAIGAILLAVLGAAGLAMFWPATDGSFAESAVEIPVVDEGAQDLPAPAERSLQLASIDDLASALRSGGIAAEYIDAYAESAISALGPDARDLNLVYGKRGSALAFLEVTRQDGSGVRIEQRGEQLALQQLDTRLEQQFIPVRGVMDSDSFYSSAVAAGVDASLIDPFANAFTFDFDLQMDVGEDDVFEATIEQQVNPSGQVIGNPKLLYVSLRTEAKSRALYWFEPEGDEPGWYDSNGSSIIRNLMRTPLNGARVSSTFGERVHPITGFRRTHRGTDFAAPTGTPVFASGDGVIDYVGFQRGTGNMVRIRHDNGWLTKYFHLNAFAPNLAVGQRIRQGDVIGEVGSTGASTGPHLHYEIWINDEAIDPQSVDTGTGKQLSGTQLAAFVIVRDRIDEIRRSQASDR